MIYLRKNDINRKLEIIKNFKIVKKNKNDLTVEFEENKSKEIKILADFFKFNKEKIFQNIPNLSYIQDLKKMSISQIENFNIIASFIEILYESADIAGVKNKEELVNEYIEPLKEINALEDFSKDRDEKNNFIQSMQEQIMESIEFGHSDLYNDLFHSLNQLEEKELLESFVIVMMDEGIYSDDQQLKEQIDFGFDYLKPFVKEDEDYIEEELRNFIEGYACDITTGVRYCFFIKFKDEKQYEKISKIILENEMHKFIDVGLEVGKNHEMFKRNNIMHLSVSSHCALDYNIGSELFKAFPVSIFRIKKLEEELSKL